MADGWRCSCRNFAREDWFLQHGGIRKQCFASSKADYQASAAKMRSFDTRLNSRTCIKPPSINFPHHNSPHNQALPTRITHSQHSVARHHHLHLRISMHKLLFKHPFVSPLLTRSSQYDLLVCTPFGNAIHTL